MVTLEIQPQSEAIAQMYMNHGSYHPGDAGLDLFMPADAIIKAGETVYLNLGIKAAAYDNLRNNVSWLIFPRSSITKTPLRLANSVGIIDSGYRGYITVALDNIKTIDYTIKKGDRLVQAVGFNGESMEFKFVDQLDSTSRGNGGFGSTS